MFYSKFKQFVKDEFIRIWRIVNPLDAKIEEIKKILNEHELYVTRGFASFPPVEYRHHEEIKEKLFELENNQRKMMVKCGNDNCPHYSKEAPTNCNSDPFGCKKYITVRSNS
jgi:hypothetical protein